MVVALAIRVIRAVVLWALGGPWVLWIGLVVWRGTPVISRSTHVQDRNQP
jgi:hypothetical protein